MSSDPQEKIGKRTIKNKAYSQFLENTQNSEDPLNTEKNLRTQNEIQAITVTNQDNPQAQSENQEKNIETHPITNTREQIQVIPEQAQSQQIENIQNNNVLKINKIQPIQQVPVESTPIVTNQVVPPNEIIVLSNNSPPAFLNYVKTYNPTSLYCLTCNAYVITETEITSFNYCVCCFVTFLTVFFSFFWICIYACMPGDFCCYEANHYCPNCKRILAKRSFGI